MLPKSNNFMNSLRNKTMEQVDKKCKKPCLENLKIRYSFVDPNDGLQIAYINSH